jgi:methylase of polypeptide subunit release factors
LPILRHGERVPLPVKVAPRVSDGVVFRILDRMLMVDGERLTYRALDVEHIGSVYEGIMGYEVERVAAESIAVTSKPAGSKVSVPVVIDLVALLAAKPNDRKKCLKEWANCEMTATANKALKEAKSIEDLVSALGRRISPKTPGILSVGSLCLQPGEERRRSGSHYTPRELTEPIVSTTLAPIWAKLRAESALTADRVLALKVCDLAMGSGAFLVEVCRQLADRLVNCWEREAIDGLTPEEAAEGIHTDRLIQARRLVAQQCLYGVDKNPFAVNLAKLSLWLFTLSKDRPFTFLDHALKLGDSLVGLTREEIGVFASEDRVQLTVWKQEQAATIADITGLRRQIAATDVATDDDDKEKRSQLRQVEQALGEMRLIADAKISASFVAETKKKRQEAIERHADLVRLFRVRCEIEPLRVVSDQLRSLDRPLIPFNWEVEFPEVFDLKDRQKNPGFDVIVGNPPFAGKNTIAAGHPPGFLDYLKEHYEESHGNSDFVAYFFRRAFTLLRHGGTFGLIATNTIAQGDTRSTGLRYLCQRGGKIYNAKTRFKWPGLAAVVVSIVHIWKD